MTDTTTHLLHIIHGLTIGGAEIDLVNKSAVLTRDYGYKITICCLMRQGELAPQAESAGIKVIGPVMQHRYDILAARQLRQILISEQWLLMHTHLFAANFVGWSVWRTLPAHQRPRLIASEHAMAERWGTVPLLVSRLIQRDAASILVPSQAAADSYIQRGLKPEHIQIIANGLDIDRFKRVNRAIARVQIRQELNIPSDVFVVGTISRLATIKGLPVLLQAVKTLPIYLLIVGDGPERKKLQTLVHSKGLAERTRLLGSRTDVPQLLAAFDVFVLPSYSETFGIVVAEAFLMKTPVIATNVGGIPEVTSDGKYAYLVPPGNVSELVKAIQWVQAHPATAQALVEQGYEFISGSLSLDTTARQQHRIYQDIIERQK